MKTPEDEMDETEGLTVRDARGLLTINFDRDALDASMLRTLSGTLAATRTDSSIRVVLLAARAGGLRCVGARSQVGDLARTLRVLPQPVVASVQGRWSGAALALLAGCDIVYTADDATFALDEADAGRFPDASTSHAIAHVMTARSLTGHALVGRPFDGRAAALNGLATLSFSPTELAVETDALLDSLLGKDPLALRFTKQTLRHVGTMDWDAVLDYNAAKTAEFAASQAGRPSARAAAVESFLAGTSKPGLGD